MFCCCDRTLEILPFLVALIALYQCFCFFQFFRQSCFIQYFRFLTTGSVGLAYKRALIFCFCKEDGFVQVTVSFDHDRIFAFFECSAVDRHTKPAGTVYQCIIFFIPVCHIIYTVDADARNRLAVSRIGSNLRKHDFFQGPCHPAG